MSFFRLILTICASVAPISAHATEEDFNVWIAQTASIDAGKDVVVWLEAQERFTDDAQRLGQLLLRPAIGYRLDESTTVFVGYAYVVTHPEGSARSDEHRIFQQLSFRILGNGRSLTLSARTRMEQRWLEGGSDTGWRLRQQVRLAAPIAEDVDGVTWTEPFIGLNETPFQPDGVGVWRNFIGFAVPLGTTISLEPGYLNQLVVRDGENRMDHVASISLNTRF